MKLMKTEDAVGQVLCHDITQIIPGVKKGPVFKKGHVITPEDVPVLLSVGMITSTSGKTTKTTCTRTTQPRFCVSCARTNT